MKLSQLLTEDRVLLPLRAADKWELIEKMARVAVDCGAVPAERFDAVHAALVARERSMTTGMERGVAIPHAAVDGIDEVVAVLGLVPDGVAFDSLDGQPARIVVCLVIPRVKKLLHIKTLAEIAKLLARAEVREALLSADTPAEVLAVVRERERETV